MIRNYTEFCSELLKAGFSGAVGGRDDGVFGLLRYGWGAQDESSLYWHTDDPDTDPWLWRVRVLDERDDVAYSKVFYRKAGYITKDWYPYFLAARRDGRSFDEAYADGRLSSSAKRIYETLSASGPLPVDDIKLMGGFHRDDKSRFERALAELQMGLYITMCGQREKRGRTGEQYGWPSMMYCTAEQFWPADVFERADALSREEAGEAITGRVLMLNPSADRKKIVKFIYGR